MRDAQRLARMDRDSRAGIVERIDHEIHRATGKTFGGCGHPRRSGGRARRMGVRLA
jgi:hypothetical protein